MLAAIEKELIFKDLRTADDGLAGRVSDYFRQSRARYFELRDSIVAFSALPENWDSYQADPIAQQAIESAIALLDEIFRRDLLDPFVSVHVFPMRDGGVQFEFDIEGRQFEVEVKPDGMFSLLAFDEADNIAESQIFASSQRTQICQILAHALLA